MPAGETETRAPSLEQILWRAMDRFREEPALLDAEEFAAHIEHAFDAHLPEEAFAERFFAGADRLHPRTSFAAASTAASRRPLHVYEFDLGRLEYVIVEDEDAVVVVSEFGQFKLENDAALGRALEAAVVKKPDRAAREPRAYFVRATGEVLGVEVEPLARTLERLTLRQVSMPAVRAPAKRLASFNPVRVELSGAREQRAVRQHPELSALASPAPPLIGSAGRWEEMLGGYARPDGQRIMVHAGNVLAIVAAPARGFAGPRALARAETLASVRGGDAPVRALGSEEAAEAFSPGPGSALVAGAERFWVQPENAFLPAASLERTLVARPLQLGEITGDPWTDWTLTAGSAGAQVVRAASSREQPAAADPAPRLRRDEGGAAPIVAFRAPDGTLVFNRSAASIPFAAAARADAAVGLRRGSDLVPRTGAVPSVALRALHLALERTAAAGGYRLPVARIDSAPDAIGAGRALAVRREDWQREAVRLAAPVAAGDHAARLLVSMPFPNRGQLHVGQDLSDALHAYLGAPLTPVLRGAPSSPSRPPRNRDRRAWTRAAPPAGRAVPGPVLTVEPPPEPRVLADAASVSHLPPLLQRAVVASGSWTGRPGAALTLAIGEVAEQSPFAEPPPHFARRPPGPGEEEIVIPLPLWARMARGAVSTTDVLLSPPSANAASAPPLGSYRLVVPAGGRLDLTSGASGETGTVNLEGPAAVRLSRRPAGGMTVARVGASPALARVPADPGSPPARRSGAAPGDSIGESDLAVVSGVPAVDLHPSARTPAESSPRAPPQAREEAFSTPSAPAARFAELPATVVTAHLPTASWGSEGAVPTGRRETYAASQIDVPPYAREVIFSGIPAHRQPPQSLRFRYVGAPLWWSTGNVAQVAAALSPDAFRESPAAPGEARSAVGLWGTILVAGAGPESGSPAATAAAPGVFAPLDGVGDAPAFAAPTPVLTAGPAYIAMSSAGAAGPVPAATAARARAQAIEMSIVAAIPPAPPPLATMSSAAAPAGAPHARGRGAAPDGAHGHHKEAEDAVSHSKIEGSVDAIAQRIYHRIRRRLQSDRERFGG